MSLHLFFRGSKDHGRLCCPLVPLFSATCLHLATWQEFGSDGAPRVRRLHSLGILCRVCGNSAGMRQRFFLLPTLGRWTHSIRQAFGIDIRFQPASRGLLSNLLAYPVSQHPGQLPSTRIWWHELLFDCVHRNSPHIRRNRCTLLAPRF